LVFWWSKLGANSGALISASQAADQGRSLYAVPGPIDRPNSLGSNRLIQQGAKLVMSVDDILEDLQTLFPKPPELVTSQPPDLEGDLLIVYRQLVNRDLYRYHHRGIQPHSGGGECGSSATRDATPGSATTGKVFVKLL